MRTFKHTIRDEQTNRCRRFCVTTAQTRMNNGDSVPLEILHFAFVLLGGFLGVERAKVATLAGLRILLARIKSILSGFQFPDHGESVCKERVRIANAYRAGTRSVYEFNGSWRSPVIP